ncbi:TRAP transporter permease [Paracoccus sediminicola]|uniref:TRAP transporter permease n=1 Tax=Paracoccus sediminicola TaxID=3017783 RepID=UPI0022F11764|nr:TRAP transporter fused permease subunit [Paracoccus sediminicola]WBU56232.1 TRAP transporter fused permease subunit [Paracoccus sediminicola]
MSLSNNGAADRAAASEAAAEVETVAPRLRQGPFVMNATAVLTVVAIILAVNQIFNLRFFVDVTILQNSYLYLIGGIFLAVVFLAYPAIRTQQARLPAQDVLLAMLALGACLWFGWTGETSVTEGWEYSAPQFAVLLSFVLWALIIEATRRVAGLVMAAIILCFSLYPIIAGSMPGPISGFSQPFEAVIPFHILSSESSFGIPMEAFGTLVLGFVLFGAALQFTGGGEFFNNLAFALVGGYRGGAAKVASIGSGLMGSMSGSVISNVMTTGSVSIPAMKRTGFSPAQAAAVEACASTGGVMMPPIMGAVAFVMASFLGVGYSEIVIAAIVPSALYYFGLIIQIDSYAARRGLRGLPRAELPAIGATLRLGWQFIIVFAVLIWMLVALRQERIAPFIATLLLLVVNQLFPRTRLSVEGLRDLLFHAGIALAEMAALLIGVGLIVGAFSATGLSGTLANDLVYIAGGGTLTLLVMGAITSFIFGMGMTVTSCYIFLAVVLAPALIAAGLDPIAVHLFIMYWGMVSYITPPVALGAFAAAPLAGVSPMLAGVTAMRVGVIIYVLPFLFVLEPALIWRGELQEVVVLVALAVAGVWLIASGIQGYLAGFGSLGDGAVGFLARGLVVAGGAAITIPASLVPFTGHVTMTVVGLALAGIGVAAVYLKFSKATK